MEETLKEFISKFSNDNCQVGVIDLFNGSSRLNPKSKTQEHIENPNNIELAAIYDVLKVNSTNTSKELCLRGTAHGLAQGFGNKKFLRWSYDSKQQYISIQCLNTAED